MASSNNYSTDHEISFIRDIGKHVPEKPAPTESGVLKLLEGYLAGCQERVVWGSIDREKVIKFAMNSLIKMKGANHV